VTESSAAMSLNAADLLFFSGNAWWPSRIIALRTCTPAQLLAGQWISHVGICFEHKGQVLMAESTTLATEPCAIRGHTVCGVQAHNPVARVRGYRGRVWHARLATRPGLTRRQCRLLTRYVLADLGTPYDGIGALVAGTSIVRRMSWYTEHVDRSFCSEWCTALLEWIGVWPAVNASTVSPAAMARRGTYLGVYQPLERILCCD